MNYASLKKKRSYLFKGYECYEMTVKTSARLIITVKLGPWLRVSSTSSCKKRFEASSLVDGLASRDSVKVSSRAQLMNGNHEFDSTSDSVPIQETTGHANQNTQQRKLRVFSTEDVCTRLAELEALEACYWLKAAGFPQYAKVYEDGNFPIDIPSVLRDHDFLDQDAIQSLYRRLQTLNRCAKLNLHIRSEDFDSDEEDLITLSSRWKLQNKNRGWSRRQRTNTVLGSSPTSSSKHFHESLQTRFYSTGHAPECHCSRKGKMSNGLGDRYVPDQKSSLSHMDLMLAESRISMYDNVPAQLTCSTPSLTKLGEDFDTNDMFKRTNAQQKRNLASSDQHLGSYPTSSNDELSDGEDDADDVSKEVLRLRESKKSAVHDDLSLSTQRRHKVRWHSFERSSRPEQFRSMTTTKICNLSTGQVAVLKKYSLLKLTALMERYTHSHRGMWSWSFPQFLKKLKSPDYRDKNVFGVPLSVILQRSGRPLPTSILYAINYLQRTALDSLGIFRKSGGKQRITRLKHLIESDPDNTNFEGLSPYDLADMIKEYFRDLPDPIFTSKLAETFISIYSNIPTEQRIEAMQAAIMLMPDENREALQTLLLFLNEVASSSETNQMSEKNLGVCFAPSLFHLCGSKEDPSAPKRQKRTPMSKATKELTDNLAAHECLTQMITEVDKVFSVSKDTMEKSRFSGIELGEPVPLNQLGRSKLNPGDDHKTYFDTCIAGLLKEARQKFNGWVSHSWNDSSVEISYKKVRDGYPLRLWRGTTNVEASAEDVLRRILRERHLWDDELMTWDVLENLDDETDVFYYVTQSIILQPKREHTVVRSWRTNLERGACAMVSTSITYPGAPVEHGVRAIVLASRYLIEPLSNGQSRLTQIIRSDARGRAPEFYKSVGPVWASSVVKIRDSFQCGSEGPETKV